MVYEIEYRGDDGRSRFQDVSTLTEAHALARALAISTGKRTKIKRITGREWRIIVIDIETGDLKQMSPRLTKTEAIRLWLEWDEKHEKAVLIFWPSWAKHQWLTRFTF